MKRLLISAVTVGGLAVSAPAQADLVFLSNGRHLSVKAHRLDGDMVVLTLRGGGEIVCERALIARIEPDEVPYPEERAADPIGEAALDVSRVLESTAQQPYGSIIDRVAAVHGVDARLIRAVIQVESGYRRRARSPKGAMGLMQLMPATARQYAVADPYDPVSNIEGGVRHLKSLLERFPLRLALAAYNAGEAAVQRFRGVPPYPETRAYVARILSLVGR